MRLGWQYLYEVQSADTFFAAFTSREKMDVIDLEDDEIDAEVLATMAVTQVGGQGVWPAHVTGVLSTLG